MKRASYCRMSFFAAQLTGDFVVYYNKYNNETV